MEALVGLLMLVAAQAPPTQLAGEIAGERSSDPGKHSDWPAIAFSGDGSLWTISIEWNDRDADRVVLRRRTPAGEWQAPLPVDDGHWDHYSPVIVARRSGVVAIWSAQVEGDFELFAAEISATGAISKPQRLTRAAHSDFNARAAADLAGNLTLVWQSYHHGNYDVYLRSFDGRTLGPPVAITTEPSAQFHSSVAVDREGRVWVAWDDGGENWGKDFSSTSAAPGSRGLHYSRSLGVRLYANGRVQNVSANLGRVLTGRMSRYAELPHLAVDGSGAMWMVFRHWTSTKPNEIYHFYTTRLSGGEWSLPYRLSASSGHNSQHAALALDARGRLWAACSSDGRSETLTPAGSQAHALHYNVYVSALPTGDGPPAVTLADAALPAPGVAPAPRPRHSMTAGGKTYRLLLGDAHRHTDIRGHSGVDGSLLDTYRYAMDAAQLDWLGTSDHNEVLGGRWPDGLRDYQWWTVQKTVDLMTHAPRFIGVYSYEHSMARPAGHRNILFLKRGAPLRMIDREKGRDAPDNSPPDLWRWMNANVFTQPGQKAVIVPHTFAAGPLADFNWPNARFDCLLEIYQGARGSYEAWRLPDKEKRGPTQTDEPGHFAQDALAKGNVYGFVSFSDHGSTHNSWAAVWSLAEDRAGILEAMYARRTYAASDEMIIQATADGRMPGEEFEASGAPLLEASIIAPDTILRVDLVRDGKYIYTTRPDAKTATLRFRDADTKPGRSYYYVRVFQRDPENPEGDPEIAWVSPFYVTYR